MIFRRSSFFYPDCLNDENDENYEKGLMARKIKRVITVS